MTEFSLGLQLMIYGLAGVFGTLILFYLIIKTMTAIARKRKLGDN
ncbi:MAG: OadG family protein [Christensenellales bacterium]|jgi:Na+-transporting methylmalonyl-CoA/oxaloacetate decarboxylase gamma subunit